MIGERLAKLRTEYNMTQESFAEQLEVSRQAVSKWELDKTLPDVNKLLKMSEMFGVSVDYILKGNDGLSDKEHEKIAGIHETDGISIDEQMYKQEASYQSNGIEKNGAEEDAAKKADVAGDVIRTEIVKADKSKTGNKIALAISATIIGMLLLAVIVVAVFGLTSKVWNKRNNSEILVRVEKIHGQYSLADVSCYTEDKGTITKTFFLDTKGIKEGDYVYCYTDSQNKRISVDYSAISVSAVVTVLILLFFAWILLIRSLKKDE